RHRRDRTAPKHQGPWLTADKAEAAVWKAIDEALRNPETFREAAIRHEDSRGARDVELQSRVAHLRKQIAKIRQDERRLIELFVGDREQQEMVQGKLRELSKQKAGLAEHLQRAEEQAAKHGALSRLDAIERLCEQARRGIDRPGPRWKAEPPAGARGRDQDRTRPLPRDPRLSANRGGLPTVVTVGLPGLVSSRSPK